MLDHTATERVCCVCHETKPIEAFYWRERRSGKRRGHCRKCQDKRSRSWGRRNPEHAKATNKKWRQKNPDKIKEYDARAKNRPEYKEASRRRYREDIEARRIKARRYRAAHKMTIQQRLRSRLTGHVNKILRRNGIGKKSDPTLVLTGCTVQGLMKHLESLWKPGMDWTNWGVYRVEGPMTWHIDHKRPCSSFDMKDPTQQRECFHYTNLQPLWAVENLSKGDKTEVGSFMMSSPSATPARAANTCR